jgi:DNA-binding MarR family transcriptional regulator
MSNYSIDSIRSCLYNNEERSDNMNDQFIVFFLSKTKKIMSSYISRRLKEEGIADIDASYGNIFTALYNNEGSLSMKEIAKIVNKDKSTITSHVKHLIKTGYLKKEPSLEDKRISIISLTTKGWEFQPTYQKISDEVYELAYKNFSEEDKEAFLSSLKTMYMNFKE